MTFRLPRSILTLMTAAALIGAVMVAPRPAEAGDLATMRERAQAVANTVTALEHDLSNLHQQQADLSRRIDAASALIGQYELRKHRAEAKLTRAEDAYRQAAVAQYESPDNTTMVALMLSSKNLSQLYTLNEAASSAGDLTQRRLERLLAAHESLDRAEHKIADRKQFLLSAKAQADEVAKQTVSKLAERKSQLSHLMVQVHQLEQKARAEARRRAKEARAAARAAARASAPAPSDALRQVLGSASAPSSASGATSVAASKDIPPGYASTGVSFQGEASWYGPGFEGQSTASGQIFHSNLMTAASKDLPLGTHIFVSYNGKGVVVLVNDRGPYVGGRVLDLSAGAARAIGLSGVGWVTAEIVVKA